MSVGDLDADGREDLVVGAPSADIDGEARGAAWVFFASAGAWSPSP